MKRLVRIQRVCLTVIAVAATGCDPETMAVSDAFRAAGKKSLLSAKLERTRGAECSGGVCGVKVEFFSHDKLLGSCLTDETGKATLLCDLPDDATHYRAEARVRDHLHQMEGLVFSWPKERTVIVCDIDGTVSSTHYRELVFDAEDNRSVPFPDAAAVLTELCKDYGLVYLTARPGFLLEKSKRWLERNGFPRAPVITTPSLRQGIGVQTFKAGRIQHLQTIFGPAGIGIGNATTDSEAYAMRMLLPILIDDADSNTFRAHAVVLRNWKVVRDFFRANRKTLMDPMKLRAVIENEGMLLRPLRRFDEERRS